MKEALKFWAKVLPAAVVAGVLILLWKRSPQIPYDSLVLLVEKVVLTHLKISTLLVSAAIAVLSAGAIAIAIDDVRKRRFKKARGAKEKIEALVSIFGSLATGGLFAASLLYHLHRSMHSVPAPVVHHGLTLHHRVFAGISMALVISGCLYVLKYFYLRGYAVLELLLGACLAGFAVKEFQGSVPYPKAIPTISSLYFLVRAIKDAKKDYDGRKSGEFADSWRKRSDKWRRLKSWLRFGAKWRWNRLVADRIKRLESKSNDGTLSKKS